MATNRFLLVMLASITFAALILVDQISAHPYGSALVDYNLNTNQTAPAGDVLGYSGAWDDKVQDGYTPSPENWRALPTYTVSFRSKL